MDRPRGQVTNIPCDGIRLWEARGGGREHPDGTVIEAYRGSHGVLQLDADDRIGAVQFREVAMKASGEGEGDAYLRARAPILTDPEAAFKELQVLSARIGWYAMYVACVRYVKGDHLFTIPNASDVALFRETGNSLIRAAEEREKMDREAKA